jgi:ubiquitin-protein ligase
MALPLDILRKRLTNEIELCKSHLPHEIEVIDPEFKDFPTSVMVTFKNIPGPMLSGDRVVHNFTHKMRVDISKEYPYQKPVVRWETEIFHPNIVPPRRGGWVCIKLLDNWSFSSNLLMFLNGIESLLVNPNPRSPYRDETTLEAARYFLKKPYKPPMIVKSKNEKDLK